MTNSYISLNALNYVQPVVMATIFDDVDIFNELFDITTADLYTLFLYEYGERLCALPFTSADESSHFGTYAINTKARFSAIYRANLKRRYTDLLESMTYDYNPIWNVDGTEVTETKHNQRRHEDRDIDSKYNQTETVKTTHAQTQTVTTRNNQVQTVHTEQDRDYNYDEIKRPKKTDTETPGTTITHAVTPYDSTETTTTSTDKAGGKTTKTEDYDGNEFLYQNRDNDITTSYGFPEGSTAEGDTVKTAYSGDPDKVETTHSGQPDHTDDNTETYYTGEADKITLTRQGNIGVTSTQKLIREQREIVDFDIVEKFLHEAADFLTLSTYDTSKI